MLRKVIQIAEKTYVISLPANWLKKYAIKKGDSIEVQEKESYLIVSPDAELGGNSVTIDVGGVQGSIKRLLGAAYKAGYDEVQLIYETEEEHNAIEKTLSLGLKEFHIMEDSNGKLRIKILSQLRHEEFEQVLRRMFLLILTSMDDINSKKKDSQKIVERDLEVNNCADFCRRSLNRRGYAFYIKTPALYYIIEQLEKIGDIIRDLAAGKEPPPTELSKDTAKFLRTFYELYYNFDVKKFDDWLKMNDDIKKKISDVRISKGIGLLNTLTDELFAMNGALLVCKL